MRTSPSPRDSRLIASGGAREGIVLRRDGMTRLERSSCQLTLNKSGGLFGSWGMYNSCQCGVNEEKRQMRNRDMALLALLR